MHIQRKLSEKEYHSHTPCIFQTEMGNRCMKHRINLFIGSHFMDHYLSASHYIEELLWPMENSARTPGFSRNSFILGWSVGFNLLSQNSNICDFQTLLWLHSLLIRRLLRGDNCFYLFIFNSWSINTPSNMTHQPLDIPHKETGLFGPTKIWFWRGAVWFHSLISLLFSLESFKDASEQLWTMQVRPEVLCRTQSEGKKKTSPRVNWQRDVSKGYAPPTHSFQLIKDLERSWQEIRKGGARRNVFFKFSVSQVALNKGQLGILVTHLEDF